MCCSFFFFFQAEDGIRDFHVTGVQTCALPIFTTTDTGLVPLAAVGPVSVVIRMPFCVTFMVFPFQLSPKESHMTKVYSQTLLVSQTSVANSVGLLHALESVSEHTART